MINWLKRLFSCPICICGGKLVHIGGDKYQCVKCKRKYDYYV